MTDDLRIGLTQLLRKARMDYDADFLKEGVRMLSQALMEMEVEEHLGAGRHERSAGRRGQRNGYRERSWDPKAGSVELRVPRVRDGRASFLRSSNRGGKPREPWQQSSRKPTSTASPPARWTTW
jgi:transposase-like protein